MYPDIFRHVLQSPDVRALLGELPTRFYPSGKSEQDGSLPYAVWQTVGGLPENYIDTTPDIDSYSIQIDVWARSVSESRSVAEALRDALESRCHITSWRGESIDPDTNHHNFSFDIDWFQSRNPE